MINDQLLSYIKQQLSLHVERGVITANLKSQGWTDMDVSEAFRVILPLSTSIFIPTSSIVSGLTPNVWKLQTEFSNTAHTKNKKIISIIGMLIFLSLAGGVAAYAYYFGVFVSLPSLVSEAMNNVRATTSGKYDIAFDIDFSEMKNVIRGLDSMSSLSINSTQFNFTVVGSFDISDLKNFKNSTVLSLNLGPFFMEAQFRIVHNIFYAELAEAPALGILPIPMISSYENKWFSFPYKSADDQMTNNPFTESYSFISNIGSKFTVDQKDHIYKMFRDAQFIKTIERLYPETINGELSYHFSFDLDRVAISSYLQSLKKYINSIGKNNSQLSLFNPTQFSKELDKIKDFKGEIWIGRNDKLLHKIVLNFEIQPDLAKDEQVKTNIVGIFSDQNQSILITAPTESASFAILISDIISNSLGQMQQKGNETP